MEAVLRGNRDAEGKTARQRLDAIAVSATAWGSLDSVGIKIQCVRDKLEPALEVIADALARPTYDGKDVEIVRGELLSTFDREKSAIGTVHGWAIKNALYPVGHPYRDAGNDRAADIRAVTRTDLVQFAKSHLTPNGMTAVVAGDVTPADLRAALAAAFGSWRGAPTKRPAPPPTVPKTADPTRRVFLVDRRGAAQTHVSVVAPSIARTARNYPAMLVFNRILGGSVSSRLFKNLREQRGLTYWVGSQLSTRHGVGELTAGGAVVKEKSAIAIREILNEIERLATEPVPPDELKAATDGLVHELPGMFEALGSVLWTYGEAPVHGLPPDELSLRPARIAAVTSEEVMAIAKSYFDRKSLRVVVTGDASVVRRDLEQLELGPVLSIDPAPAQR
jgi:predicted Zn-dependent peptidase